MRNMRRFPVVGAFVVLMMVGFGASPGTAQSRAHVYLLRGLMNIFSLGMDTLAEEIQRQGIYATVHNYAEWQTLADRAAVAYRARREGPIIIIGHSLGADAVMEMSAYLGRRGVPVALAVPFDAKQSYATPSNVGRLLNLTHAGYGYMSRGVRLPGFTVQCRRQQDPSIDHLNIDKSPRLHSQVLAAIIAAVGKGGGTDFRQERRYQTRGSDADACQADPRRRHSLDRSLDAAVSAAPSPASVMPRRFSNFKKQIDFLVWMVCT